MERNMKNSYIFLKYLRIQDIYILLNFFNVILSLEYPKAVDCGLLKSHALKSKYISLAQLHIVVLSYHGLREFVQGSLHLICCGLEPTYLV